MKKLLLLASFALLACQAEAAQASPSSRDLRRVRRSCQKHFRARRYVFAAYCYRTLFKRSKHSSDLLNTAMSYRKAAAVRAVPRERSSYLREKALHQLRLYARKVPAEKRWTLQLIRKVRAEIGYATLSIETSPPMAQIALASYRFSGKGKSSFKARLRPGIYRLSIRKPGFKSLELRVRVRFRRSLQLRYTLQSLRPKPRPQLPTAPHRSARLAARAPKLRSKLPAPAPRPKAVGHWIALAGAVGFAVAGGVVVGLSIHNQQKLQSRSTPSRDAREAAHQLQWQTPVGWGLVGLSGASALTSLLLYHLAK